jgi:hypothetical protein
MRALNTGVLPQTFGQLGGVRGLLLARRRIGQHTHTGGDAA